MRTKHMRIQHNLVDLAESLSEVENDFPVDKWEIQGIQFWPILKNIIYFDERRWKPTLGSITSIFLDRKTFKDTIPKVLNRLGWDSLKVVDNQTNLSKANVLFSGTNSFRVRHNDEYWNKFFDPIMDEVEGSLSTFMVDYSIKKLGPNYKEYRLNYLNCFKKNIEKGVEIDDFFLNQCVGFKEGLTRLICLFDGNEAQLLKKLKKKITSIIKYKLVWNYIIEQVEPDIVFCLCYYNEPMYGLLLAAKDKGIPTVDMQHGGQGKGHPAYHFSCSEEKKYNTLPDFFWVWESSAAKQINNCFKTAHSAYVGGNPWIRYLMKQTHIHQELDELNKKKKILCTLTWGMESLLPDFLHNAILESPVEYEWWLRYHPNTPHSERKKLAKIIADSRIEDRVELTKSNEWPLPFLLKIAWAHISHSSGSLFEASIVGLRRNIVTSELGANNFSELIDSSKAFYFNCLENKVSLIDFVENLDVSNYDPKDDETVNYANSICAIIKQFKKNN